MVSLYFEIKLKTESLNQLSKDIQEMTMAVNTSCLLPHQCMRHILEK